jgi:hypothetical protein
MANISKEEIKEIVKEVGRSAFWLCVGILAYASIMRWVVD